MPERQDPLLISLAVEPPLSSAGYRWEQLGDHDLQLTARGGLGRRLSRRFYLAAREDGHEGLCPERLDQIESVKKIQ